MPVIPALGGGRRIGGSRLASLLPSEFQASLGYMRTCLKKKNKKEIEKRKGKERRKKKVPTFSFSSSLPLALPSFLSSSPLTPLGLGFYIQRLEIKALQLNHFFVR